MARWAAFRSWAFTARGRAARYAERNTPVHGAGPDEWTAERRESWLRTVYGDDWYKRHTAPRGTSVPDGAGRNPWVAAAERYAARREARTDRWRDTAIRDIGRGAMAAWTRIDPDGWFRPSYGWWLAREVAAGRNTLAGAWACWCNNPGQDRYSRRRADAVRRIRRMDWRSAAVAVAGGRLAVRSSPQRLRSRRASLRARGLLDRGVAAVVAVRGSATRRQSGGGSGDRGSGHVRWADVRERRLVGARAASSAHSHPRWPVRRWRVASWIVRGMAGGSLRPAAVPDAWVVACAASDGIHVLPLGDGRSAPDA